jgi:hypothetical protein
MTSFFSGSELRAQIPGADVTSAGTANVTVFTQGAGESAALNFSVIGDNPAPAIARLAPNIGAVGGPAMTLNVFGANFTPQSVIRLNGAALTTTRISSVQLTTQLQANALAMAGDSKISVFTPGPGGGTTSDLTFSVVTCSFALSSQALAGSSLGGSSGVLLTTGPPCAWTATADQPWITITNPANGAGGGKFVINFSIAPNTTPNQRTGNLMVGGQTLSLREFGRVAGASAASFSPANGFAPESIAALFGAGMAKDTIVASTQPLPTTLAGARVNVIDAAGTARLAPLFFAAPGQINLLIPTGSVAGSARALVQVDGVSVSDGLLTIAGTSPGLFAANSNGQGVAAALVLRVKADNSQIYETGGAVRSGTEHLRACSD